MYVRTRRTAVTGLAEAFAVDANAVPRAGSRTSWIWRLHCLFENSLPLREVGGLCAVVSLPPGHAPTLAHVTKAVSRAVVGARRLELALLSFPSRLAKALSERALSVVGAVVGAHGRLFLDLAAQASVASSAEALALVANTPAVAAVWTLCISARREAAFNLAGFSCKARQARAPAFDARAVAGAVLRTRPLAAAVHATVA